MIRGLTSRAGGTCSPQTGGDYRVWDWVMNHEGLKRMKGAHFPSELQDFMVPGFDRGQQALPQKPAAMPRLELSHEP